MARAIYSILINRYQMLSIELKSQGKQIADEDLIKIITKCLKELQEEKLGYEKVGNLMEVNSILKQEEVLRGYLPKMMSEQEILDEMLKLEDKSIPSVMKHFKANFEGKAEMSLVNKVARSIAQ